MRTLRVVEGYSGWRVEFDGRVVFADRTEQACFVHALATSGELFDQGIQTRVELARICWDNVTTPMNNGRKYKM